MRNPWIQRLQRVSNSSPYFLCIVPLCSAYVGYLRNQNVTLNLGDIYGTPIANRVRLITFVVYAPKLRLWFNRTLWAVLCDYIYSTLCTLIHIYSCEVYIYICKCMCTYPTRVFLLASIVASHASPLFAAHFSWIFNKFIRLQLQHWHNVLAYLAYVQQVQYSVANGISVKKGSRQLARADFQ